MAFDGSRVLLLSLALHGVATGYSYTHKQERTVGCRRDMVSLQSCQDGRYECCFLFTLTTLQQHCSFSHPLIYDITLIIGPFPEDVKKIIKTVCRARVAKGIAARVFL
jgi:hypothetical protein